MANNNLFYQLYSSENNYVDVGYTCDSAINESEISFDITDNKGVISDSNGNMLADIDLSKIHINPVTDYASNTKVINPGASFIIQGPTTGPSFANQEFAIPNASIYTTDSSLIYNPDDSSDASNPEYPNYDKSENLYDPNADIADTSNYEYYIDASFVLEYNSNLVAIDTSNFVRDSSNLKSIVTILQNIFDCLPAPIAVSIVDSSCISLNCVCECADNLTVDRPVLRFTSNTEGYPFFIKNMYITPKLVSTTTPDSPFTVPDFYYADILMMTETYTDLNDLFFVKKTYTFTDFYKFIMENITEGLAKLGDTGLDPATVPAYCYAPSVIEPSRLKEFYQDLAMMKGYNEDGTYSVKHYLSTELTCNQVGNEKYPNGAMQGILVVPTYPTDADMTSYKSLKLTHIKDKINLFNYLDSSLVQVDSEIGEVIPRSDSKVVESLKLDDFMYIFNRKSTGLPVDTSTIVTKEVSIYTQETMKVDINTSTTGIVIDTTNKCKTYCGSASTTSECYPYLSCVTTLEDTTTEELKKAHFMRFLKYVNDNDLWINFGQLYAVLSNGDSENSDTKNLIPSVFIYNPNTLPIKINYMVFS